MYRGLLWDLWRLTVQWHVTCTCVGVATCPGSHGIAVKYLDSNKSWVTPEVVSSNQCRIRLEMSRVATTRLWER